MKKATKLYVFFSCIIMVAFVPWLKEFGRVEILKTQARLEKDPVLSFDQIRSEMDWVLQRQDMWGSPAKTPDSPILYWEYLDRRKALEDGIARFLLKNTANEFDAERSEVRMRGETLATTSTMTALVQDGFQKKFGAETMVEFRPRDGYALKRLGIEPFDVSDSRLGYLFLQWYICSIFSTFGIFCTRLHTENFLVWPELHKVLLAAIWWPIGLFVYPKNINREEQVKKALRFAVEMASAIIGIFGGGIMTNTVKAQSGPQNKSSIEKKEEKKSGSTRVVFGGGSEMYPIASGYEKGAIASPFYFNSIRIGKGFRTSGFGFVEIGETKGQLFTNNTHSISHDQVKGLMFTTETGWSQAAGIFFQVSPRVNLAKAPVTGRIVSKAMKFVNLGRGWRVRGPSHFQETFLGWASRELPLLKGLTVATEGFMRFRDGKRMNVGQPQILFRHKKLKWIDFLSEISFLSKHATLRIGVQIHSF